MRWKTRSGILDLLGFVLAFAKLLLCQISLPFNGEQICKICTSASRSPWWISFTLWASERRFAICLEIVVGELESLCKVLPFYEFIWLLSFIGQAWRLKFRQSACLPLSLGFCFFLPFFIEKGPFSMQHFLPSINENQITWRHAPQTRLSMQGVLESAVPSSWESRVNFSGMLCASHG